MAHTTLVGRVRLWQAVIVTLAVTGVVVGLFDSALGIRVPAGLLLR